MLKDKLKELRKKTGLSAREVGLAIHRTSSSIYGYEKGLYAPNPDTLKLLCKLFGVSPNEMLEWD